MKIKLPFSEDFLFNIMIFIVTAIFVSLAVIGVILFVGGEYIGGLLLILVGVIFTTLLLIVSGWVEVEWTDEDRDV